MELFSRLTFRLLGSVLEATCPASLLRCHSRARVWLLNFVSIFDLLIRKFTRYSIKLILEVQRANMCVYRTRHREWAPGGRAAYSRTRSLLTANKGASTRISTLYTPCQRHWALSRWFGGSAGVQSWWKVPHCFQLLVMLKKDY